MLTYKGYVGHIEFDDEAEIFHGEVINIRDVVTFQGSSVDEIKKAFKESVDDYLEFCASRGEEPEKPYSGRLNLRLDPTLHREVSFVAKKHKVSLNQWIVTAIKHHMHE